MAQRLAYCLSRLGVITRQSSSLTNVVQLSINNGGVCCGRRTLTATAPKPKKSTVSVTFIKRNGESVTVCGKENSSLLDLAVDNDLDLEGFGICEGTVACSTCHVILKKEDFDKLNNEAGDDEHDMLDMVVDLTPTSRLGCQVFITKELNGITVKLPTKVEDARTK